MAEVIAANTGAIVTEPDRAVGFDDDVIGAGQLFTLEAVGQYDDRAVVLGAGQPLRVHLAGHQPPLAVARVAVCVMRRLAEHADGPCLLLPLHHPVVRDVAPDQTAKVAKPYRTFIEAASTGDLLDCGIAQHERLKAWIEGFYP